MPATPAYVLSLAAGEAGHQTIVSDIAPGGQNLDPAALGGGNVLSWSKPSRTMLAGPVQK